MKLLEVSAYDGTFITLADDVVDHIVRKHSEVLAFLTLMREDFVNLLCKTLEEPNEVYVDVYKSRYFLKRLNDFYLNVVVSGQSARTAYLIGRKTYSKMRRKRWLRRLC